MTILKALIFDVDGTLAETERDAHRVAFNETFAQYQLDWHWSEELYGQLLAVTGGKERIKYYLDCYRPDFLQPDNIETFIAEIHQKKTNYYNQLLVNKPIPLRLGVKRLLQEARQQGLRLAIATTTSLQNVVTLLESSLDPQAVSWFEIIAAGDMVKEKKPAADVYLHALQHLNLPAAHCLAFEDSYNGLCSALGAQIKTIITINDYTCHENFNGATLVLDHLGEPNQTCSILGGTFEGEITQVDVALLHRLIQE